MTVAIGDGDCWCDDDPESIKSFLSEAIEEERYKDIAADQRWHRTIEFSPAPGETEEHTIYCYGKETINRYLRDRGVSELVR